MAKVTLQLLEGLERGLMFRDLPTPVTIGREDDNTVRLNDERVSRFHAKIQEDGGQVILTDLESTNGTRINGHPIQMRVLQIGDQIAIGRCLLLFGSPEEITAKVEATRCNSGGAASETTSHTQFGARSLRRDTLASPEQARAPLPFASPTRNSRASFFPMGRPSRRADCVRCSAPRFPTFSVTATNRSAACSRRRRKRRATAAPCGSAGRTGSGCCAWKWSWPRR